jgi:hypothetical protein
MAWGILARQIVTVASFASVPTVLIGHWSIFPTRSSSSSRGTGSSGGAVAPPLLPWPFALVSRWLPSGATVTALRDPIYCEEHQHAQPIAVQTAWALGLFAAMVLVSHRLRSSPGGAAAPPSELPPVPNTCPRDHGLQQRDRKIVFFPAMSVLEATATPPSPSVPRRCSDVPGNRPICGRLGRGGDLGELPPR